MPTPGPIDQIDRVLTEIKRIQQGEATPLVLAQVEALEISAIRRLAPVGTSYREQAERILADAEDLTEDADDRGRRVTMPLRGVLLALRHDYEAGFMSGVEELIHASLFSDFLEMALHLVDEGYKDPAAVLTGGVLESHLRKLAEKSSIAILDEKGARKASALNDDMARARVYGQLDHKNVVGWLEVRNDAAHADWKEYNAEQVRLMIAGVREFLARLPA